MAKYRVYLATGASLIVTVEAESAEQAEDYALDNDQYICASCTGWGRAWSLDIGEWEFDESQGVGTHVELIED